MPRNLSGVYSLPAGSIVSLGQLSDPSQHNPPLQDIAAELNAVSWAHRHYATRAALAAASVPSYVTHVSVVYADRILWYSRANSAAAATSNSGTVHWKPAGTPSQLHWGGSDAAALQGAIDWVYAQGGGDLHIIGTVTCDDTVLWYPGPHYIFIEDGCLKRPDASPGYILSQSAAEGFDWRFTNVCVDNNWPNQGSVSEPGSDPDSTSGVQHNPFVLNSAANSGTSGLDPNSGDILIDGYEVRNLGPYANGGKLMGFTKWSINKLRAPDGGGYNLWHIFYVRRCGLGRFVDWLVKDAGSHVARISGLGRGDQVDADGIMADGCGRGVAIFDIGQVNIDCNIRNALWGAANGIAVVSSEARTQVRLGGVVDRCGQFGVNLTNVRDIVSAGLAVNNCGVAAFQCRNVRQAIFDNVQISFRDMTDLRRPLTGGGAYQIRWRGESHTLESAANITARAFQFIATGASAQQILIGQAVQVFNTTAATIWGVDASGVPNGQIDIPDDWEARCVGVAMTVADPNRVTRRPTLRDQGENWEVIRRPDGTQTTRWRVPLGAMGAAGAGTATDPYRTAAYTANWPGSYPFRTWPTLAAPAVVVRSSTAVERFAVGTFRRASESQLVQLVAYSGSGSAAGTADVWAIVEANGRWKWVTSTPVHFDFAAQRYAVDGVKVPFAPNDIGPGAVTLTRASSGQYIHSDGKFYAATTDVARFDHGGGGFRTNLAHYSDDLSNGWWAKGDVTLGGLYPKANGDLVAYYVREDATTAPHYVGRASITISSGAETTVQVEFGTLPVSQSRRLTISLSSTADAEKWVAARFGATSTGNIATNVVGAGYALAGSGARIVSLGNGRFRAILSGIIDTATDLEVRIGFSPAPADLIVDGDVNSGAEVWGTDQRGLRTYLGDGNSGFVLAAVQIEAGTAATRVIDTAGSAVTAWGTRALLLEPAAVNLVLHSNDISNVAFTKTGATIGTPVAGPFDGINEQELVENSATGTHRATQTVTITAGRTLVVPHIVRRGTGTRHFVQTITDGTNGYNVRWNLATGALAATDVAGTGTVIAARCVSVQLDGNRWLFYAVGAVDAASTSVTVHAGMSETAGGSVTYTGDGASSIFIAHFGLDDSGVGWGTSPIVTAGATGARAADVATVTGVRDTLRTRIIRAGEASEDLGAVSITSSYSLAALAQPETGYRVLELFGEVAA